MKKSLFPAFLTGVLSAVVLFAGIGTALAASGTVSFNTGGFSIGGIAILNKGEDIQTESGTWIPSSLLYTDELGGGTYYVPIRVLAQALDLPLAWDASSGGVDLTVGADLHLHLLPLHNSGVIDNAIQEVDPIDPAGGASLLSTEWDRTDSLDTQLELKPGQGRYVSVTVTNQNGDKPIQFDLGLKTGDAVTTFTTQVPAGDTVTRTIQIVTPEGEALPAPYLRIGNPADISRRNLFTVSAIQFDGP